TKIAYFSDIEGKEAIWISDRDGTHARKFLDWNGSRQIDPDWSPDGESIVFASDRDAKEFNLWRVDVDGKNPRQLTAEAGHNSNPRYAPDGRYILFLSNRTGVSELWLMDPQNRRQQALGLQGRAARSPSWSPDGRSVVYSSCAPLPNGSSLEDLKCTLYKTDISARYTKDPTMGTAVALTDGRFVDDDPDWEKPGIFFIRDHCLWLAPADGRNPHAIQKNCDAMIDSPKWDPHSGRIFYSKFKGDMAIWSSDLSGREAPVTKLAKKHQ
ncbi:MAG TPA: hypothetical protein VIF12_02820, partial [Micavibrio sp.]